MGFLADLVKAIDNDWLRFEDWPARRPMSMSASPTPPSCACSTRSPSTSATSLHSADMRRKVDEAVVEAKTALEFVDSIPALANAAAALSDRLHGRRPARRGQPFEEAMRFASFEPALSQLMAAITPIVTDRRRDRIARGELSFDDLLVLTRRLLQTRAPTCGNEIRARHRYLFVDEFQDTDQVQFDVIRELTAPTAGSPPSSLFAVGDPKQSIYGFRHADVELFSSLLAADEFPRGAHRQPSDTRPTCARGSTRCSSQRFARSTDRRNPSSRCVHGAGAGARRQHGRRRPRCRRAGNARVDEDRRTRPPTDTARAEAADIAALVQQIVGPEGWSCHRPESGASVERPASYRDITVLIRSRTRLGVLEHTLRQAGVPYRVEGGTLIYGSREVYELLRVLRAVDDPTNQLKVVTALRTIDLRDR